MLLTVKNKVYPQNYPSPSKKLRPATIAYIAGAAAVVLLIIGIVIWNSRSGDQPTQDTGKTPAKTQPATPEGGKTTPDTTTKPKTDDPKAKDQPKTDAKKPAQTPSSQPSAGGSTSPGSSGSSGSSGGGTSGGGSSGNPGTSCSSSATHTNDGPDGAGGCWPGASNTGVPSGTVLTAYSGPSTITTSGTTIIGKTINTDLFIQASGVVIKNSRINGHIDVDGNGYSLTIEDSEVHASSTSAPAIGYNDITVRRVEVTGGQHSISCSGNCVISDNWLHDQYNQPGGSFHNNAFISNGGNNMTLTHNTLDCTPEDNGVGGGCTADASFFGDFAAITNATINNNLFVATPSGGYCGSFGHNPGKPFPTPSNVVVTNNIFQRGPGGVCGIWGPATSFLAGSGSSWSNNKYDDGSVVNP